MQYCQRCAQPLAPGMMSCPRCQLRFAAPVPLYPPAAPAAPSPPPVPNVPPWGQSAPASRPAARFSASETPSGRSGWGRNASRKRKLSLALVVTFSPLFVFWRLGAFNAAPVPVQISLSGHAYVSTPLADATIDVYELKSDGQTGALLASTTTDAGGYYTVSASIGLAPSSSLLVTTTGGSSVDEISGKPTQAGPGDSLKTIVTPGGDYALLTPLTTIAASRTTSLIAAGNSADNSIAVSYGAIARQYNLETLIAIDPAVVSDPQSVKVSGITARQMGLILAGLDEEAATFGATDFGLVNALARDISDGTFDGKEGATQIIVGDPPLPPDAATLKLEEAISKFTASPINASHLPTPQIVQQPANINLGPGVLFVASPGLPAFADGQAGSAPINPGGGTAPISCTVTSGIMPVEFVLLPDCSVQYSGVPVLGTSTMRITDAFTVTMSDSSKPSQSVNFDLRITITGKPPAVTAIDGTCPQVHKSCTVVIATATGKNPPFYFSGDSFGNGAPPMGMIIGLDGKLTGTPSGTGAYTFDVCATDVVGAQACTPTTVTIEGPSSPSAPPAPPATAAPNAAYYLHWSCGGQDQCAAVMGGPTGIQGVSYASLSDCQTAQNSYPMGRWDGKVGTWCDPSKDPTMEGPTR